MKRKDHLLRMLLRSLLSLYPASFIDRVGESMEQTIEDVFKDSDTIDKLSLLTGLSIGAVSEHLSVLRERIMSEGNAKPFFRSLIGFLFLVPGLAVITLLVLGINPPLGPLEPYFAADNPMAKWLGLFVVLGSVVALPLMVVFVASRRELKPSISSVMTAILLALPLVVPLVVLQLVFGSISYSSFPSALFTILWLLPAAIIFIARPVVATVRNRNTVPVNAVSIALRFVAVVPIAVMWFGLVNDQMPCFMGVPNCD